MRVAWQVICQCGGDALLGSSVSVGCWLGPNGDGEKNVGEDVVWWSVS